MSEEKRILPSVPGFASHAPQGRSKVATPVAPAPAVTAPAVTAPGKAPTERGGPSGPEPTRYGDWERNGRCSDF